MNNEICKTVFEAANATIPRGKENFKNKGGKKMVDKRMHSCSKNSMNTQRKERTKKRQD